MSITVTIDTESDPGSWARAIRHRNEARVDLRAQHEMQRKVAGSGEGQGAVNLHTQTDTRKGL